MKIETLGESLYWSYANLGMAHCALSEGAKTYGPKHYSVRNRLYTGFCQGSLDVRLIVDDERLKMILPQACCYCASSESLAADHLIPRKRGGIDSGDNLVWACRACNSSKQAEDVLVWLAKRGHFPPLLLLRRYLKLAIGHSREHGLMDVPNDGNRDLPFDLSAIPHKFPSPKNLILWVTGL